MVRIILRSITTTLVLRSALPSLSKDARVSKDGHKRDRACGHPSRRPRQERGLLRMRSEGGECGVRYDWFHGIAPLDAEPRLYPRRFFGAIMRLSILIAACVTLLATSQSTQARITKIKITRIESPTFDGRVFGNVGPYEKLAGNV